MGMQFGTALRGWRKGGCQAMAAGLVAGLILSGACGRIAPAQESPAAAAAAAPDAAATLNYIHKSWDELSRSMTDCHSLVDTKVAASPVLYLPAELAAPEAVKRLAASCGGRS